MGTATFVKGVLVATWTGVRHFFRPRMTLSYPEQKLDLEGPGYRYDPKTGTGLPGFKGRHILYFDKCTGCQLCAIACDGVAVAIEMQHLPKGKPQNKKEIWPAVDYGRCVPTWTPIVTSKGIVPIENVLAGDKVLTHAGRFRTVTEVFRRRYSGRIYTFTTLGNVEPLTVTEEHPILVQGARGLEWTLPRQIGYRTYLTRPVIRETQLLPKLEYSHSLYHPAGRGGYFTLSLNELQFTPDLARLIGYYLAEGNSDRYRVSFDIHKKEEAIAQDIVAGAGKIFDERVSFKPDNRSQGLKLVIDSVRVATFFNQFGTMCDEKVLPSWALQIPESLQAELIKAAYLGDGHYSNKYYPYLHSNYFVIRTTSRTLANQYTYILNRLGIVASVCKNIQEDRKVCYSVTVHTPYIEKMSRLTGVEGKNNPGSSHTYVRMTEGMIISPVVEISVENVTDLNVMNLEVEEDNSFVASNQVVHNCVFCGLCVDPETEVATNPGLKPIKDIKVGERVLTHTGAYRSVSKIWRFAYTGPMYEIKAMGKPNSLLCTSDHRLLTVKRPSSKKSDKRLLRVTEPVEMVLPKDVKAGDYLLTPIPKKVIRLTNYRLEWNSSTGTKIMNLRNEPDLFRLIGYYLAEGSVDVRGRTVSLSFGSSEPELVEDARRLLHRYFGKEPHSQELAHHVINVRLGLTFAMLFFTNFGRGAANKALPDWVFFASKERQVQLIKGMWLGDGCVVRQPRQKYLNITTTSKVLAYQLQTVLTRLGVVSAIHCEIRKNRLPAYRLNVFGRWAVKLAGMMGTPFEHNPSKFVDKFLMNEDYVFSPIESISSSHVANREVRDITVEGDHTFVGQGIVQHNCVDACPFDALFMTNDYELSSYDKPSLKYSPDQLAIPPKTEGYTFRVKIDPEKGTATHG